MHSAFLRYIHVLNIYIHRKGYKMYSDIIEDAILLPLLKWEAVEYFSMCQRDINRFLHEPLLAIALGQDSEYRKNVVLYGVLQNVVSEIELFFHPFGSAFLTVETLASLLKRLIQFFCAYVLFLKTRLIQSSIIFESLTLKINKKIVIKFVVDVDIDVSTILSLPD